MATVSLGSAAGKWVMVPTILASSMAFIDGTALNVVLPSLQQSLHASGSDLFWILNSYLLMLAALILVGGAMGDRLGRKRVFMIGIAVFVLGSAACGLAGSVEFFIGCRIVQGIGGALMIPGSLSLIASSIDAAERGKAIGTWSAFTTVVTMGGPVLGGALADAGLWRAIFYINVPIGLAALVILWTKVSESREEGVSGTLDIGGAVTVALGLALVTFGCLRAPALGLHHWQVAGSLALGGFLLAMFLVIERRSKDPMMPLPLFANRNFSAANLLTFFLYAGLGAGMLFLGLNLVQVQGYSQLQSGMSFLPFTLLMIGIARRAGSLADRYGPRLLLTVGPGLAGCGLFWLSLAGQTAGPSAYWRCFFPGILVFGLGMSLTVAPLTATVMRSVGDHLSGTASGINNALTRVANVFANAIFGAMAVVLFAGALQRQIDGALQSRIVSAGEAALTPAVKKEMMAQAANLGNAQAPAGLDAGQRRAVVGMYHTSFLHVYAVILRLSAGLAWLGAMCSVLLFRKEAVRSDSRSTPGAAGK